MVDLDLITDIIIHISHSIIPQIMEPEIIIRKR